MIKRNLLNTIFFTISCFTTYGSDILTNYFNALKNFEYNNAREIALKIDDSTTRVEAIKLSDVLFNAGQNPNFKFEYNLIPNNDIAEALYKVSYGYQELYTNPYTIKPFRSFLEAYTIAKTKSHKPLIKFCLLAILEVYSFEISQSNYHPKKYLKEYYQLIEDNADLYHYYVHDLHHQLRRVDLKIELVENFHEKFANLMSNFPENHKFWPNYYSLIGVTFKALKNYDTAEAYLLNAINRIDDGQPFLKYIKFRSYINLSDVKYKTKLYLQSLNYIELAKLYQDNADSIRSKYYIDLYSAPNYSKYGEYKKAYKLLNSADSTINTLNFKENSLEIALLKEENEAEEKEKENLRLKTDNLEKENQILIEQQKKKQNRNIAYALGGLTLLGTIIFILIQKNTKRKQLLAEQGKELQTQKLATVLKEQELTSIDAMIEGQEKERQRIANDLHDDLGGLMATVKLHFNALKDKQSPELFDKTNNLLDEAYNKIRTVAHAKNSGVMAKQGLLKAVKEMAHTVSTSNKMSIDVIDHGLDERLENSLELTIFRIIQELVTNVIKHAQATEATIHLTNHDDTLNIMVEDNGKGFNTKKILKTSGMGIHSIDKRIENLGGTVTIESEPGKGTTVIIDIPS